MEHYKFPKDFRKTDSTQEAAAKVPEQRKRRSFLIRDILGVSDGEETSDEPGNAPLESTPNLQPEVPSTTSTEAVRTEEPEMTEAKVSEHESDSMPSVKPFRTISMETTPIDKYLDLRRDEEQEEDSLRGPDRKPQKCSICNMFQDRGKLKKVEMDSERLIVIVGFVLNQKMTATKAKELASTKQAVYSCAHHFSDVFHEIRNSLKLRHGERMSSISGERIQDLMEVVNTVRPQIKPSNFMVLFELSAVLNKHRIKDLPPIQAKIECPSPCPTTLYDYFDYPSAPSPPPAPFKPPICLVCSNPCRNPREVIQGYLRLIMSVGWVLANMWSEDEAKEIMSSGDKLMACHSHFLESIDFIFHSLNIRNRDVDLVTESNIMVMVLMRIVHILRPGTTCTEFVKCFRQFDALNKDITIKVKMEPE